MAQNKNQTSPKVHPDFQKFRSKGTWKQAWSLAWQGWRYKWSPRKWAGSAQWSHVSKYTQVKYLKCFSDPSRHAACSLHTLKCMMNSQYTYTCLIWTYSCLPPKTWQQGKTTTSAMNWHVFVVKWQVKLRIPVVPHKAVAEVSKIGNL
jgi:hypothetical protein